jgi:hypothetical protein
MAKTKRAKQPRRLTRPRATLKSNPPLDALNEAIKIMDGIVAAAAKLKVTVAGVQHWRRRGVPPERCKEIELLTGVSRARLRPDIYA